MPSPSRSSSTRRRAVTRIQKRVRGKQTRKKLSPKTEIKLERIKTNIELSKQCAICLDMMKHNEAITRLQCGHRFHSDCIQHSLRSGNANCPICRAVIPNNDYAHLANPNMTWAQAVIARNQALQERRLATEALSNAVLRTTNYEQSNRSRRLRGINSPTYIRLLRNEEDAGEELRRARERVTNTMNIIRRSAD